MLLGFALSSPAAYAEETHEYVKSFGPDGTAATSFEDAGSVAVDQEAGLVYVFDPGAGSIYKFDLEGNPVAFTGFAPYISGNRLTGFPSPFSFIASQVAVDPNSHTIYLANNADNTLKAYQPSGEPSEFTAGPGAGTNEISSFSGIAGVTVDAHGAIYVSDIDPEAVGTEAIKIFAPSGEALTQADTAIYLSYNLAVDSHGLLFVNSISNVAKLEPSQFPVTDDTTYTFTQVFSPNRPFSLAVNLFNDDVYVAEYDPEPRVAVYNTEGKLVTSFAGPGQEGAIAQGEGVGVVADTGRVFVSDNPEGGPDQVKVFRPVVAAPTIKHTYVTDVSADAATLGGVVNPNTLATSYHFEYGLGDCSAGACTSLPSVDIGQGYSPVEFSLPLADLEPGTTYHYRLVAKNAKGTNAVERTFTTQGVGFGFTLPDSRAWEMVSPPDKHGAQLVSEFGNVMRAAEDGNGLVYQSALSIEEDPEGSRATERSSVLARRIGGTWRSKDLTPPNTAPSIIKVGNPYKLFSPDLESAVLTPADDTALSPQASARMPYLRTNTEPPVYVPMVTAKEGFANVPPGTDLEKGAAEVMGADRDLSHVALRSPVPLSPGAEPGSLYLWSKDDGQLQAVSSLPLDQGGNTVNGFLGSEDGSVRNAVSEGGSRVFWSQGSYRYTAVGVNALYVRDFDTEETLRLDTGTGMFGPGGARPLFLGASADGRVVFFTDTQQLTENASPEGADLYRCVLPPAGQPLDCDLTNLTGATANPGESAEVQGVLPGLADDGSKAYFVARGVLDPEPNQGGESAVSQALNLYLWQQGAGPRFIATLSPEDKADWGFIDNAQGATSTYLSATASPSGRYLAFMSERSLTGYENRDPVEGDHAQEVFRYDAVGNSLICASCNPTGASPRGQRPPSMIDFHGQWTQRPVAAVLPEALTNGQTAGGNLSNYRSRSVLDNGRVFFDGSDALVAADSNGRWDVYQYEPTGVGDCAADAADGPSIVHWDGGCVSLLSSGTSTQDASFLDASVTGDDVFFLTSAQLSVTDVDGEYDVYDARVNGVAARLEPKAECQGEACQPAAVAPNDPTPGTATFKGPGNPKPKARRCRKGSHRVSHHGKARCVPRKHAKGRNGHRKAGHHRRASR